MLGKAIIATILGAGVTGGAVYIAAHPEVLEPAAKREAPAAPTKTQVPAGDDTKVAEVPSSTDDVVADREDGTPVEVILIDPQETETPVLPEAKQLTERTVIAQDVETPELAQTETAQTVDADVKARRAASANLRRIMTQAGRMASPDLRDQAYLSAVEYALDNSNYTGANKALDQLSQPQLRDTARSKIAVKYAQEGRSDKAFDVIDAVEIDDLRDFMRLQVIEAITAPE